MSPTLLVVQHVDHEGPDLIGRLASQQGLAIRTLRPDQGDALPPPGDCPDCLALVLGGPMGVNDRHSAGSNWLQTELDWLATWHQAEKPVIGICLGAQLLAVAAGGSVEPLQVGEPPQPLKEVGLGAIHWLVGADAEPLLEGLGTSTTVLHWHGDRIRLPEQATLLGSSLHCAEQVFRIGRHALGLQCHLEVSTASLEQWIAQDEAYVVSAMGAQGPAQIKRMWQRMGNDLQLQGSRFFTAALRQLLPLTSKRRPGQ